MAILHTSHLLYSLGLSGREAHLASAATLSSNIFTFSFFSRFLLAILHTSHLLYSLGPSGQEAHLASAAMLLSNIFTSLNYATVDELQAFNHLARDLATPATSIGSKVIDGMHTGTEVFYLQLQNDFCTVGEDYFLGWNILLDFEFFPGY
ncbi:uncharacterized protein [Henckelia pumila]|uniref:uncharacterized protein n=1 Tax=Henckelia pumila TaxID=405737 RepID=UPI003C6DDBD1